MIEFIELYASKYKYTIQALVAVGTWFAIFTSLKIANEGKKQNLEAFLGLWEVTDNPKHLMLRVTITNHSINPVKMNEYCMAWYVPWVLRRFMRYELLQRAEDLYSIGKFVIDPQESKNILISLSPDELLRDIRSKFPKYLRWFIRFYVHTDTGSIFKVRISKRVKQALSHKK